ncbi:hypothetical protein SAY86_007065 [Trapa natans]|uniref:DUF506 family protein n=1 Tax=Trapa natans TaxID=22666 RepID=A0AAN7LKY9_TRANT|nr:hypothetical protein SAY86_007065 [Trapa natans]
MPPKIQPIDSIGPQLPREPGRADSSKLVLKSRFKRLFDRQFPGVLRNSSAEKLSGAGEAYVSKDGAASHEFEPSSLCLAKMVQNFIEENNEKQSAAKCGRNRCNCFNGNNNDSSDDEFGSFDGFTESAITDISNPLKALIPCASVSERNLLADTARIMEKNRSLKRKDDLRTIVVENLISLGYDSSICKSKWDKTSCFPAGEYEYIDVIVEGERLLIDVDFRSEFEIARSTGAYKAILQSLPYLFVGKAERIGQIVAIVSEAAKQSLRKKGMHVPPWRKAEYMRAKWLSPYTRAAPDAIVAVAVPEPEKRETDGKTDAAAAERDRGELELIFGEDPETEDIAAAVPALSPSPEDTYTTVPAPSPSPADIYTTVPAPSPAMSKSESGTEAQTWQPPALKPKSTERSARVVTGLASLLKEKP